MNQPTPLPPAERLRVVGYIRASTPQQRTTILAQYEMIRRHCETYGFLLDEHIRRTVELDDGSTAEILGCFIDAGVSAEKVDFLNREDAAAMLEHMTAHGIRDIIGTKVDRVFRDVDDARWTVRTLEERGTRFHLLDVGGISITVETAAGLFILTLMAAVAEYENGRKSERQMQVNDTHREQRTRTGRGIRLGEVPYGWDTTPGERSHGKPADDLVPNPFEQTILARLLHGDLSQGVVSQNEAARQLNKAGIPTKKGKQWYGATVDCIRKTGRLAPGCGM
jgi:DNA invertase Pin-like site-specific DNA recombinase